MFYVFSKVYKVFLTRVNETFLKKKIKRGMVIKLIKRTLLNQEEARST